MSDDDFPSLIGPISIPYSINGLKVKAIGQNAFSYCYNITHVFIKAELISIEFSAFKFCYNLQSVNIPASVTYIGVSAFGLGKPKADGSGSPPSAGEINITIESPSQLKHIDFHGICCKHVINIYYCGNNEVMADTKAIEDYKNISIYSPTKLKFADHDTTPYSFACVNQQFLQHTCHKIIYFQSNVFLKVFNIILSLSTV